MPLRVTPKVELDRLIEAAHAAFGERNRQAKNVAIHLAHRFGGLKLREIGARFGLKESGVSEASRRVSKALAKDESFRLAVQKLREEVAL